MLLVHPTYSRLVHGRCSPSPSRLLFSFPPVLQRSSVCYNPKITVLHLTGSNCTSCFLYAHWVSTDVHCLVVADYGGTWRGRKPGTSLYVRKKNLFKLYRNGSPISLAITKRTLETHFSFPISKSLLIRYPRLLLINTRAVAYHNQFSHKNTRRWNERPQSSSVWLTLSLPINQ